MKQPGVFLLPFRRCIYPLSLFFFKARAFFQKTYFESRHILSRRSSAAPGYYLFGFTLPGYLTGFGSGLWNMPQSMALRSPFPMLFDVFKANFSSVAKGFYLFWVLSVFGLSATFFRNGSKMNKVFILLFSLFSFLSICPGFYFRQHYFVTLLPAVSILVGVFIDFLNSRRLCFSSRGSLNLSAQGYSSWRR